MTKPSISLSAVTKIAAPPERVEPLWWWGLRAFRREVLDFRFNYDVQSVDEPVAAGLDYHIRSDALFFDAMRLDEGGIPIHWSRTFQSYNPMYVAWYGLTSLQRWLRGGDANGRERFLRQVDWLVANAQRRDDGLIVWPLTFDWTEGRCELRAPWPSAMAQGLSLSALVRAYRLGARKDILPLCLEGTRLFEVPLEQGGVVTREHGHAIYEEYPGRPLPRILDGYLFSLLGLYDVAEATGNERVHALLQDGLDGLTHELPFWDYHGIWSWYGSHGYLCPPHYHILNTALLRALGRLTERRILVECARRWDVSHRTAMERAAIYTAFLATKNRSRLLFHARRRRAVRPRRAAMAPPRRARTLSRRASRGRLEFRPGAD